MRTRYSLHSNINKTTMINCSQDNRLAVQPSFDFGFKNILVHNYRQME